MGLICSKVEEFKVEKLKRNTPSTPQRFNCSTKNTSLRDVNSGKSFSLIPCGRGFKKEQEALKERAQAFTKCVLFRGALTPVSNNITAYFKKTAFTLVEGGKATFHLRQFLCAFTLAEVLITIGIIGIVAALTIPNLIQKNNEKTTASLLKKIYSTFSQAYTLVVYNEGSPDTWDWTSDSKANSKIIYNKFKPYLKKVKECEEGKCINNYEYKYMNGTSYSNAIENFSQFYTFVLPDGSIAFFEWKSSGCTVSYGKEHNMCFSAFIDINGNKQPNTLGKDYHAFRFFKNGTILPSGAEVFDNSILGFKDECGPDKTGFGCTAWIIMNENMDFLRCADELGWDKNKSCK